MRSQLPSSKAPFGQPHHGSGLLKMGEIPISKPWGSIPKCWLRWFGGTTILGNLYNSWNMLKPFLKRVHSRNDNDLRPDQVGSTGTWRADMDMDLVVRLVLEIDPPKKGFKGDPCRRKRRESCLSNEDHCLFKHLKDRHKTCTKKCGSVIIQRGCGIPCHGNHRQESRIMSIGQQSCPLLGLLNRRNVIVVALWQWSTCRFVWK